MGVCVLAMGESSPKRKIRRAPVPRLVWWIGGWVKRGVVAVGRGTATHVGPVAARAGRSLASAAGTATVTTLRQMWHRRAVATGLAARAAWWGALWLLVQGTAALLGINALGTEREVLTPFVAALVLTAAVALLARDRHVRAAATVLGAVSIAVGVLASAALTVA